VAVTGEEANECSRAASEFSRRLDWIESLQGKEKEQAMKPYLSVSVKSAAVAIVHVPDDVAFFSRTSDNVKCLSLRRLTFATGSQSRTTLTTRK
jgi:hypothetical protein